MASEAVRQVLILTTIKVVLLLIELLTDSTIVAARHQLYMVPAGMLLGSSIMSGSIMSASIRASYATKEAWKFARQDEFCDIFLLGSYNAKMFKSKMRMSKDIFHMLCAELAPALTKETTRLREPLPVELKVAAVLYKLAHGTTNSVISDMFGIGACTVSNILREFVTAVLAILKPTYVRWPTIRAELKKLADGFECLRGIPRVVGAIDGSHIPIIAPREWPADYYNRKGYHSILLQGIVDSNSCFWNYDIGWAGSLHDYNLFRRSKAFDNCEKGSLQGFTIVGDAAYQPRTYMLTPFLGCKEGLSRERYFWNFIQSSTRMPVECAFGILKLRWSILLKRLDVDTAFAPNLIACCLVLHNICQVHKDEVNVEWYNEATELLGAATLMSTPSDVERQQLASSNESRALGRDSEPEDEDPDATRQEKTAYRLGVQFRNNLCRLLYDQERASNMASLGLQVESDDEMDIDDD
jgi:hypothetical protein